MLACLELAKFRDYFFLGFLSVKMGEKAKLCSKFVKGIKQVQMFALGNKTVMTLLCFYCPLLESA